MTKDEKDLAVFKGLPVLLEIVLNVKKYIKSI
jgi:hypothetical protein